ncbi:PTPRJ phosphatase, partial [Galbula dea]|nr:PTPRJ phosphatase [Galbula dea]
FTEPRPALGLKAEYIGLTSVNLTWVVNDTVSNSCMYRIEVVNDTSDRNVTSSVTKAEVTELIPGTKYTFTVFVIVNDSQTKEVSISLYTKPSPVLDLRAEYVGMTVVNLTWAVNDSASSSYTYRIEVVSDTPDRNVTSSVTEAEVTGLIPGTEYTFTVFSVANDGQTEGEGVSISLYTKPSPVLNLKAEYVGMTVVNLTWAVNDSASSSYTYRIEVVSDTPDRNVTSSVTEAEVTGLIPGTEYTFTVFSVANDGQTEGEGVSISLYT